MLTYLYQKAHRLTDAIRFINHEEAQSSMFLMGLNTESIPQSVSRQQGNSIVAVAVAAEQTETKNKHVFTYTAD